MLRAEIEAESLRIVTDISEICNTHKHTGASSLNCDEIVDADKSDIFPSVLKICVFEPHLAFTGADTHVAVFSVKGVGEQPQTLCVKKTELKIYSQVRSRFDATDAIEQDKFLSGREMQSRLMKAMMADLSSELPLPLSGDFRAGADLWVDLRGLRRVTQLLGQAGLQGLLAHE